MGIVSKGTGILSSEKMSLMKQISRIEKPNSRFYYVLGNSNNQKIHLKTFCCLDRLYYLTHLFFPNLTPSNINTREMAKNITKMEQNICTQRR